MNFEVKVSVIVPVYNVDKYLEVCIDSILNQTYHNMEIILVDDGSSDNSGKICDDYANRDSRIFVVHKENGGLSDARNVGIEVSTGEILIFIDSDDFVSSVFVEGMILPIIKNEVELVILKNSTHFYDEKEVLLTENLEDIHSTICTARNALEQMFYQQVATGAQFKVCTRRIFNDIRFPKGYLYEDVATTYKEFFCVNEVAIVNADIYAYRLRNDSITRQNFNSKKMIVSTIREQLLNDKDIGNIGLVDAATSRIFQMVFNVFLQIPETDAESQRKLWNLIKKDRWVILRDKSKMVTRKNKYGAVISFAGMRVTHLIGNLILHRK